MLLFVHMHKSAGTTVRKLAERSGLVLPARHRNGNLVDADNQPLFYAGPTPEEVRRLILAQYADRVQFMAIEHDFPPLSGLPLGKLTLFTILRDPLDRAISSFRYAKLKGLLGGEVPFTRAMTDNPSAAAHPLSETTNYHVRKLNTLPRDAVINEGHLQAARRILRRFAAVIVLGVDDLAESLHPVRHQRRSQSQRHRGSTDRNPHVARATACV